MFSVCSVLWPFGPYYLNPTCVGFHGMPSPHLAGHANGCVPPRPQARLQPTFIWRALPPQLRLPHVLGIRRVGGWACPGRLGCAYCGMRPQTSYELFRSRDARLFELFYLRAPLASTLHRCDKVASLPCAGCLTSFAGLCLTFLLSGSLGSTALPSNPHEAQALSQVTYRN